MAAADVAPPDWAALQQQLGKKATFEASCRAAAAHQRQLGEPAARALLARARQLLKARYTSPAYWAAGRQLFQAALPAAQASGDAGFVQQLQESIAECNEVLEGGGQQAGPAAPPAATRSGFLFEGIMGGAAPPPPGPLGLLDLLGQLGPQVAAAQAAAAAAQQQQGGGGGGGGGEGTADEQGQRERNQQGQQQQGQQQGQPVLSPEMLEALESELDAIAVQIMEETAGQAAAQRPPPASKQLVASLPRERLTPGRLAELGGADVKCPVCMEELAVGDEVQVLPCEGRHVFHPPCLAPWLAEHNSCPTCRHELPTDDHKYEARKERERRDAEDARGAANAVSHNEFLYI